MTRNNAVIGNNYMLSLVIASVDEWKQETPMNACKYQDNCTYMPG